MNTVYIVESRSGVNPNRDCLLGTGATKEEALLDAYGPKPWNPKLTKLAKRASVRQVTEDELEELEELRGW